MGMGRVVMSERELNHMSQQRQTGLRGSGRLNSLAVLS